MSSPTTPGKPEERIAFVVRKGESFELYTIRSDGSDLSRVWADVGLSADVVWSPDYSRIAFTYYPSRPDRTAHVYVANSDGSGLTRLSTQASSIAPVWSPDGERIVYDWVHPDNSSVVDICVVDVKTREVVELTDGQARKNVVGEWSPDGARIFFLSDRDDGKRLEIYVMNADGSEQRRLTYTGLVKSYFDLSPDGTRMLFVGATVKDDTPDPMLEVSDRDFRLFVMNSDGSGLTQLPLDEWQQIYDPSWSPQGDRIVFVGDTPQYDRAIYVVDSEGTNLTVLAQGAVAHPAWSRDGEYVAFHCEDDICVANRDGTNVRRLETNLSSESLLQWVYW